MLALLISAGPRSIGASLFSGGKGIRPKVMALVAGIPKMIFMKNPFAQLASLFLRTENGVLGQILNHGEFGSSLGLT